MGFVFNPFTSTLDKVGDSSHNPVTVNTSSFLSIDGNQVLTFAAQVGSDVVLTTTNFDGQLSSSESTAQLAFDRLDDFDYIDDWSAGLAYRVGNVVVQTGLTYRCIVAHTAGTFATDLSASKWEVLAGNIVNTTTPEDNELVRFDSTTGKIVQNTPTTAPTLSDTGILNINNATDATTAADGSLQTDGGLSVTKKAFIGTGLIIGNASNANITTFNRSATAANYAVTLPDFTTNTLASVNNAQTFTAAQTFSEIICNDKVTTSSIKATDGIDDISVTTGVSTSTARDTTLTINGLTSGGTPRNLIRIGTDTANSKGVIDNPYSSSAGVDFKSKGVVVGGYVDSGVWAVGVNSASFAGNKIYGVQNATAPTALTVGERASDVTGTLTDVNISNYTVSSAISVPIGCWDIYLVSFAEAYGDRSGVTGCTYIFSTNNSTSNTGGTAGLNRFDAAATDAAFGGVSAPIRLNLSAATNYYFKFTLAATAATTAQVGYRIIMNRVF